MLIVYLMKCQKMLRIDLIFYIMEFDIVFELIQ